MSSAMFSASVESAALIAMLGRLAHSADFVTREVGKDTAERIVREALSRVRRATGVTASEIHYELSRDGKGYVVLGYRVGIGSFPIDKYLEFGTKSSGKRPFFFSSAQLEEGPHLRRLTDRVAEWLEDVGR